MQDMAKLLPAGLWNLNNFGEAKHFQIHTPQHANAKPDTFTSMT